MDPFKNKAVSGIKWSFIDNLANSGITFFIGIVLARLLSPTEFGIIGYITVFIAISNVIVEGGFATALIRKHNSADDDYNTVFYSNLSIALLMMLLLILFSGTIAEFFKEPVLQYILPVMSLLLIVNAFTIIQRTIFVKNIDFKTQAKISLIASTGSGVIGITLALFDYGVWSLVAQQVSRQVLLSAFLWYFSNWRPRFVFSKVSFDELFGFGSKILIANLVNTIYQNIFLIIIGKIYSTEQLGKYTRSEQFNTIFTNNLTMIIQKVSFPMLSSIQDDRDRLVFMFRKTVMYSAIVTFSLVLSLAAVAKPLILILIGEQWIDSVLYLQIMCFYGILYPITNINISMVNIQGRSDLLLIMEIVKKFLFIPVFIVGYYYSLTSMLLAAVVYYYIEFYFNSFYAKRFFNYGTWQQLKDLFPIFCVSIFVSLCIWSITFFDLSNIVTLLLQILTGIILFPGIYGLMRQPEYLELKKIAVDYVLKRH